MPPFMELLIDYKLPSQFVHFESDRFDIGRMRPHDLEFIFNHA